MSTHPYIPLFVDDFEAATAHLTPEEDGIYNRLMRLCWRTPGCSLPNDPAWIARKIRLTAEDFERIAGPVLAEFFTIQRNRYIQRRLKREYDDISRKKTARKEAGKKGGDAKARKTQENVPSIATALPAHTRAFPDPHPDPQTEEENAIAFFVAPASPESTVPTSTSKSRSYPPDFEQAWKAYPHHPGRSSKPGSLAQWLKLPVPERADLLGCIERFRPRVEAVCGGKGAPCMSRWLKDGKHLNWSEPGGIVGAPTVALAAWTGPAAIWSLIAAESDPGFANRYLSHCRWDDARHALITASPTVSDKLRQQVGAGLSAGKIQVIVEQAA